MRGEHMWTTRETAAVGGHGPMMRLRRAALRGELKGYAITINAHPAVVDCLKHEAREDLEEAQRRYMRQILMQGRPEYHIEQFDLVGQ